MTALNLETEIAKRPTSSSPSISRYRPDIDGLRGISIIAVILFHARVPGFDGGYVGVDVFFVISGYLITSILLRKTECDNGIVSFYERRIRRIFPALFGVLFGCTVISVVLLLPGELARFGQSLVATSLFIPNIFFWQQTDYFSPISENAPFLHMWSLGVEEQFYLLYPVVLLFIRRFFETRVVMIIAMLATSSFALSVWAVDHHPGAGFYLAPTRAWELLLGALISMGALPQLRKGYLSESYAILGLLLIAWSVVSFSGETPFPGYAALLPCMGTALIIYTGNTTKTLVSRALSLRPIVFLGLISYSLYIWHWPLLAFSRRFAIRSLDAVETGAILATAVAFSVISWKFVEQPFRKRDGLLKTRSLFKAAFFVTLAAVAAGAILTAFDGFPQRVSPAVRLFASGAEDMNPDREQCHLISAAEIRAGHLCELGEPSDDEPTIIIWGDSHAAAMMPAFIALAEKNGSYGLFASHTSCPPLIGIRFQKIGTIDHCQDFNKEMLALIGRYESAAVVLIAYWSHYSNSRISIDWPGNSAQQNDSPFAFGLDRTLQLISRSNRKLWLVQQVPVVQFDVPSALAMAERRGIGKLFLQPTVENHNANVLRVNETFRLAQKRYSVTLINPQARMCDQLRCQIEFDGKSLYRDSHHLSDFGAEYLEPLLERTFNDPQ